MLDGIEFEFAETSNTRCKTETEQGTESEYVIGEAFGVGGMFMNIKLGFMMK